MTVTVGVVSGFAPAPGAGTTASPGGAAAAASDAPANLFDALLALVAGPPTTAGSNVTPAPTAEQQAALVALLNEQPAAGTAPENATGESTTPAVEPATAALLTDLIDQLVALQATLEGSGPIDPAAEKKLSDTLDALAAALGIQLPQTPPAMPVPPTTDGGNTLDPLATIAKAAVPATTGTASTSPPELNGTAAIAPTAPTTPPADGEALSQPPPAQTAAGPEGASPDGGKAEPLPVTRELADKLVQLATALQPKSPDLAKKLEALADRLSSGEIDAAALARAGLGPDTDVADTDLARAIERLLTPTATVPKPMPAPAAFTAASLTLPTIIAGPKGATTPGIGQPSSSSSPPAAPADRDAQPAADTRTAARPDRHDRSDRPEAATQRPAAAPANAAQSAADSTSSPGQSAQAASITSPTISADARALHAAYRAPVQQLNIPQIAVAIVRQVEAGNSRFQIRLDPPELGRIDVKLDVDKSGNVHARMTVERSETLDLMQRDQRSLERALAQAGLDGGKTNLEFSLRQNPFARDGQHQHHQQGNGHGQPFASRFGTPDTNEAAPVPQIIAYRGLASAGGVNLFV